MGANRDHRPPALDSEGRMTTEHAEREPATDPAEAVEGLIESFGAWLDTAVPNLHGFVVALERGRRKMGRSPIRLRPL